MNSMLGLFADSMILLGQFPIGFAVTAELTPVPSLSKERGGLISLSKG
jgi:hypothetical protein